MWVLELPSMVVFYFCFCFFERMEATVASSVPVEFKAIAASTRRSDEPDTRNPLGSIRDETKLRYPKRIIPQSRSTQWPPSSSKLNLVGDIEIGEKGKEGLWEKMRV